MTDARYPPSPPSSTSLPEHWQFVPPPTDGPNTRARRAQGLQPFSGTAAPLPVGLAARGPISGEAECQPGERWDSWHGADAPQQQQQFWYTAGPSSSATYYAIDPTLGIEPSNAPQSSPTQAPSPHSRPYINNAQWARDSHYRNDDSRRVFSTASVIDHGSPPASPGATPALPELLDEPQTVAVRSGGGISKEEWLRLGGFAPDEADDALPVPLPVAPPVASTSQYASVVYQDGDVFRTPPRSVPYTVQPIQATSYPPHTASYALPPPPASAPPATTYSLAPVYAYDDDPNPELPVPPPLPSVLEPPETEPADGDVAWDSSRAPERSARRRAPSPLNPTRLRPEPYPTSSSSSAASASPRVLTPVSTALALYEHHPVPSEPPKPSATATKKKHGRKFSPNHVPRPRNAFILFRSHAVTAELIPRSMGITDHKNISQVIGSVWRGLSPVERKKWEDLAEEEKRLHKERYPDYVFRPKQKGQRAPVGEGKKAKAKAARLAADRAREGELAGSGGSGVDDAPDAHSRYSSGDIQVGAVGDDVDEQPSDPDYEVEPRSRRQSSAAAAAAVTPSRASPRKTRSKRPSLQKDPEDSAREQRRMELIGQAMLEGEDDDAILLRVEAELAAEEEQEEEEEEEEEVPGVSTGAGDIPVNSPPREQPPRLAPRPSPVKSSSGAGPRASTATTPRKTRSSIQQRLKHGGSSPDIPVRGAGTPYASPGSAHDSDSTLSPSPYRRMRVPASPASSSPASPSPQRMAQPRNGCSGGGAVRSPAGASAGGRHPLSRSVTRQEGQQQDEDAAEHDLPAARRHDKTHSYAAAGLGIASAPSPAHHAGQPQYSFPAPHAPPAPQHALSTPLFAGAADSRQFSLGRWELRKPSAAVVSRREMLAAAEEDEYALQPVPASTSGWLDSVASPPSAATTTTTPALSLDPHAFLSAAGLDAPSNDALSEYGTAASSASVALWDDGASSAYETAASSAPTGSRYGGLSVGAGGTGRLPLFRAPSSAAASAQSTRHSSGGASYVAPPSREPSFHFGEVDLFAQPASAFGTVERTVSSLFGPPPGTASVVEHGEAEVGLGIRLDGGGGGGY